MISELFIISTDTTIRAAQIQGIYSLISAVIGAVVIIFSIMLTAKFTLKAHKAEKIAEAKRDIYLELISQWEKYISTCSSYKFRNRSEFYQDFLKEHLELNAIFHKSSFISSPKLKFEIMEVVASTTRKFKKIIPLISFWYDACEQNNEDSKIKKIEINLEILRYMQSTASQMIKIESLLRDELGVINSVLIDEKISQKSIENYDLAEKSIKEQY